MSADEQTPLEAAASIAEQMDPAIALHESLRAKYIAAGFEPSAAGLMVVEAARAMNIQLQAKLEREAIGLRHESAVKLHDLGRWAR